MILRLYIIAALVMAVDLASKFLALQYLFPPGFTCGSASPGPAVILTPFLNLTPAWNPGVSFGLFDDGGDMMRYFLVIFAVFIGLALPYVSRNWGRWGRLGGGLMAGGALGNAVDRAYHGCVVDFIDVHAGGWHWPAFNIADCGITIGVGLILLSTIFPPHTETRN